jgi:hypothetical protein
MKRNMLILSAGLVIVALLSVSFAAVMAEPVSKTAGTQAQDIKKILGIVKNTQAHVVVVENQVSAPHPSPIRYEYYTAPFFGLGNPYTTIAWLFNNGDTVATVQHSRYFRDSTGWNEAVSYEFTIYPGTLNATPSISTVDPMFFKFSTTSKDVVPYAQFQNATTGEYLVRYLPGDFHKVEIYDEWA